MVLRADLTQTLGVPLSVGSFWIYNLWAYFSAKTPFILYLSRFVALFLNSSVLGDQNHLLAGVMTLLHIC